MLDANVTIARLQHEHAMHRLPLLATAPNNQGTAHDGTWQDTSKRATRRRYQPLSAESSLKASPCAGAGPGVVALVRAGASGRGVGEVEFGVRNTGARPRAKTHSKRNMRASRATGGVSGATSSQRLPRL